MGLTLNQENVAEHNWDLLTFRRFQERQKQRLHQYNDPEKKQEHHEKIEETLRAANYYLNQNIMKFNQQHEARQEEARKKQEKEASLEELQRIRNESDEDLEDMDEEDLEAHREKIHQIIAGEDNNS